MKKTASPLDEKKVLAVVLPANQRQAYFDTIAVCHELAQIRCVTTNPMAAMLRLKWWEDELIKPTYGQPALLLDVVNARRAEIMCNGLYPDTGEFLQAVGAIHTAWLGCPDTARKWGLINAVMGMPNMAQTGLCFAPQDWFADLGCDPHQIQHLKPNDALNKLTKTVVNGVDLHPPHHAPKLILAAHRLLTLKINALHKVGYNPFAVHPRAYQRFLRPRLLLASVGFADKLMIWNKNL